MKGHSFLVYIFLLGAVSLGIIGWSVLVVDREAGVVSHPTVLMKNWWRGDQMENNFELKEAEQEELHPKPEEKSTWGAQDRIVSRDDIMHNNLNEAVNHAPSLGREWDEMSAVKKASPESLMPSSRLLGPVDDVLTVANSVSAAKKAEKGNNDKTNEKKEGGGAAATTTTTKKQEQVEISLPRIGDSGVF